MLLMCSSKATQTLVKIRSTCVIRLVGVRLTLRKWKLLWRRDAPLNASLYITCRSCIRDICTEENKIATVVHTSHALATHNPILFPLFSPKKLF